MDENDVMKIAENAAYVKLEGAKCLSEGCTSWKLMTVGKPRFEDKNILQDIQCGECGRAWTDVYSFNLVQVREM